MSSSLICAWLGLMFVFFFFSLNKYFVQSEVTCSTFLRQVPITAPVCVHPWRSTSKKGVWHDSSWSDIRVQEFWHKHISVELPFRPKLWYWDILLVLLQWPVACPIDAASLPDTSIAEKEHASPWVPITLNDSKRMEHMQIVPQFHCHAKHKAWSFIKPVISCTPPCAQTMNPSPSSMLLFVFNCQEKENKRPVTRHCKSTAVSCKQNVRVLTVREETLPAVFQSSA